MRLLLYFWVLTCGLYFNCFAQQAPFQNLTVENGMLNNMVIGATQDNKGFMWFATISGIERYDGISFTHFKLPVEGEKGNEFSQIIWIASDNQGKVWISTKNDLYYFDYAIKSFVKAGSYRSGNNIMPANALFIDRENCIWISTSAGLLTYKSGLPKMMRIGDQRPVISSVTQDKEGRIWVASNNNNIACYEKNGRLVSLLSIPASLSPRNTRPEIISLYIDPSDLLWMGTREQGVYVYDLNKKNWRNASHINNLIKNDAIRSMIRWSKTKELLIATDGQGLFRVDSNLQVRSHDIYLPDNPQTLSSNAIYQVYEDSFKRVWISTHGGGVNYMADPPAFQTFSHVLNNPGSLYNNMARCAAQDQSGRTWFGTSRGISIFDANKNTWDHIPPDKNSSYKNGSNVLALLNSGDGYIWAGTYGEGLKKIKTADNSIVATLNANDAEKNTLGTNYIFCLYQDKQKRIWAGGIRGDLTVMDSAGTVLARLPARDIHAISEDKDGNMLVAGTNGLSIVNFDRKEVERLLPKDPSSQYLFHAMSIKSDGNIALGTNGSGLIIYDLKRRSIFAHYTEKNGLPSNFVTGVLEDNQGRLWISTSNGLSCFYGKDTTFMNYTHADGLPGNQFNSRAYYKTLNGTLIFGSTNGFISFDPGKFQRKVYPSRLVFTDFKIAHQQIIAGQENGILTDDIDETQQLKLNHDQRSFSLDFINITSRGAEKNLYSWKLEGFDTSWSPVSALSTASYTNLDPGQYTLRVKAYNHGLSNSSNERRLFITILRPWYRTGWAYLSYLALFIAAIAVLRKTISISLARKRYLEQIRFFSHIAHDLRTPLTLISSPIHSLLKKRHLSEDDKTSLELAERNANRLNRLVTQLLDFQKADFKKMRLQVTLLDVTALIKELLSGFKPLLEEKGIRLTFSSKVNNMHGWIDQEKFEKIMYNLVSNAIKYSRPEGQIKISLAASDEHYYTIAIADTGIGIPEKQQPFIFNQYYRANNTANLQETGSGLGLVLTKMLIELHKGKINFESKVGAGSKFYIMMPREDVFTEEEKLQQQSIGSTIHTADHLEGINKKKERILVVEDNNDLRQYMAAELLPIYTVQTASNGQEGLKMLKEHDFNLIISDIMMPGMDGYSFCAAVKRDIATCHIPVILLTAIHDHEYRLEGLEAGADDYVEKPFNIEYLKSRIDNLLRTREILKQKFYTSIDTSKIEVDRSADDLFIQKAMEIVTQNLSEPSFTIDELCSSLAVSRPVFFRKIKALTGLAPQDFIRNIRLKKAAELLLTKKHTINEIAFFTGFGDAKYFSTAFKKMFGKSPSEYARQ
ncbi:MAG TPA: two-component regulator propeller domain-containing protein [Niabella sp.]|nr:two-component regulator propeller domain-containing protein [Niabella sp.]